MIKTTLNIPFYVPTGRVWQLYKPADEDDGKGGTVSGELLRENFAHELAQAFQIAVEEACATRPANRNEAIHALEKTLNARFWPLAQRGSKKFGSTDSEPVAVVSALSRQFAKLFPEGHEWIDLTFGGD